MDRNQQHLFEFGPFRLDTAERLLLRNGERVALTPKVFETLVALVEHRGHLIEKDQLMKLVWPNSFVEESNLTNNISSLRKALGENDGGATYIETIPRIGYRFTAQVRELPRLMTELVVEKHSLTRIETHETEDEVSTDTVAKVTTPTAAATLLSHRRALSIITVLLMIAGIAALVVRYRPWATSGTRQGAGAESATRSTRTIAVLPFKTIGAGNDDEYLGVGMADALITRLSRSRQIIVRPTSAVRRYIDPHQDPVAAGRQQGVEVVLDGSIQRAGDRVRVTVQLVSVAGGESIWSGQFDEPFTDIFAVQDAISQRVMSDLLIELNVDERVQLNRRGTVNADAYQEYLKGRFFWNKRTKEGLEQAIAHFRRAIELDASYAQAYAGLGDSILLLSVGRHEMVAEGRAAVRRAIEFDEALAEAHDTLAMLIANFDHDWVGAEREYKRALELNPNYPTAHHRYGEFLAHMGRFDEGLVELRRAQELDPLSLIISADTGKVYLLARQYDRAIEQCRKTLEMDPSFTAPRAWLGFAYSLKGQHEDAIAEMHQVKGLDEGIWLSFMGYVYGAAGRRAEAQAVIRRLSALSKNRRVPPSSMMLAYTGLGEKGEAFKWAERMFEQKDVMVLGLKVNPVFDSLRDDPRYASLLRRAGFPETVR